MNPTLYKDFPYLFDTITGKRVNLANPDPAVIDILDIAHALAQTNRYGGHLRSPYSVAEHCGAVADEAEAVVLASGNAKALLSVLPRIKLAAQLHDAAEAYVGDVISPLKKLLGAEFSRLEEGWHDAVMARFGLSDIWQNYHASVIDLSDKALFGVECIQLRGMTDIYKRFPSVPRALHPHQLRADVGWRAARISFIRRVCDLAPDQFSPYDEIRRMDQLDPVAL